MLNVSVGKFKNNMKIDDVFDMCCAFLQSNVFLSPITPIYQRDEHVAAHTSMNKPIC